ncbi:hypothetical protein CI105_03300 [Candidatus Izimaplasma bacterium ZiA1]|uniref:GNAT family N-acetyltransferase n=1 Tax=Candidatus Izimoplasma sp. ZiA1 TaxID=2024899 RepID=UPI000BAA70B8|nr:hypothetical protein CI105_03300 [Candidatus Izimaplasma bacterium ZiA1]
MIKEINSTKQKSEICRLVLSDLPEWFGIEESLNMYIRDVQKYPMFAYYQEGEVCGFYCLREENKTTLDMYVLGVKKKYHHLGIGSKLQKFVNDYALDNNYENLIVLTLSDKHSDKNYAMTRNFYLKQGFKPLYESDKIWGKDNPTLIMMKNL